MHSNGEHYDGVKRKTENNDVSVYYSWSNGLNYFHLKLYTRSFSLSLYKISKSITVILQYNTITKYASDFRTLDCQSSTTLSSLAFIKIIFVIISLSIKSYYNDDHKIMHVYNICILLNILVSYTKGFFNILLKYTYSEFI